MPTTILFYGHFFKKTPKYYTRMNVPMWFIIFSEHIGEKKDDLITKSHPKTFFFRNLAPKDFILIC